jgi:hypothetical protein
MQGGVIVSTANPDPILREKIPLSLGLLPICFSSELCYGGPLNQGGQNHGSFKGKDQSARFFFTG